MKHDFKTVVNEIGNAQAVARVSSMIGGTTVTYECAKIPVTIETSHGRFRATTTRVFVRGKMVTNVTGGVAALDEGHYVAVVDALNADAEPVTEPKPRKRAPRAKKGGGE